MKQAQPMRPLTPERQELAAAHVPIAYRMAWKSCRRHGGRFRADDTISEAMYALVRSAAAYDESRGVPFAAYAVGNIRRQLRGYVTAAFNSAWRWREWPQATDNRTPLDAVDFREPNRDDAADAAAKCERLRQSIPAGEYALLYRHYGHDEAHEEIGFKCGLSRQRVTQLVARAERKAREVMPDLAEAYA